MVISYKDIYTSCTRRLPNQTIYHSYTPSIKPFVPPQWTPPTPPSNGPNGPICPAPTLWSIVKNSLPNWGIPNAKKNFEEKVGNFEDLISFQMSKMANKMHKNNNIMLLNIIFIAALPHPANGGSSTPF